MNEQIREFLSVAAETSPKEAAEQIPLSDDDLDSLMDAVIDSCARDMKAGIIRTTGIGRLVLALQMTRHDSREILTKLEQVIAGQKELARQFTRQAEVFGRLAVGIDGMLGAWKADRQTLGLDTPERPSEAEGLSDDHAA